ncbi:NHLM bacteriocin system ABC transporter peptidase/ATP-binding protein [Ancylobacter aquaticus]|uniref:NHLM bacteriocin system ABC transporter peptidase/ATP-binding protein n=2 Tax=Ancylobacter aquaticus TaxID=100 RepID=A0A4R1HSE2_ANCAQ|nr:NHLM bacteriocin system ABC transporter peptidase/ATP-binding protein [Ancylobacter aquaticus]
MRPVHTPTILQLEAAECGAAALGMVLAAHGLWVPLSDLRVACGVSRDGSRAGNLLRAARGYGMEANGFRLALADLKTMPVPLIAFVDMNHFVVVEGFAGGKVLLNDPAFGRRRLSEEEFDRHYSGIVLSFARTAAFQPGGNKPPILPRLLSRLTGGGEAVLYAIVSGLALVLVGVVMPSFTQVFVDYYLIDEQVHWVKWLLAIMVAAALGQGVLTFLSKTILQRLKTRIAVQTAGHFVLRMLRLPLGFYAQRYAGSIGGRVHLAQELSENAAGQLVELVVQAGAVVFFLAVMTGYSPPLTGVVLVSALLNLGFFLATRQRLTELQTKATIDNVKLGGKTMQGLQMIETLKASGADAVFFSQWSGQHALVVNQQQEIGRRHALLTAMPEYLGQLTTVAVLVVGGWLVMDGPMTIGTLVGFQLLASAFNVPVQALLQAGLLLQAARGTLDQFDDVLDHSLAPEFAREAVSPRPARRLEGAVNLSKVEFGYSLLDPPLLTSFDLALVPGSRVGLVGASGSGKSTVGRLVAGLYEPWTGTIHFDGRALGDLARAELRDGLCTVDQDIVLFGGTVRDNITMWDQTMPEARVIAAARDAMVHDDITRRPGGYDSLVAEGGRNFSGGQRQRIEIARALVNDPAILILDEATSALDPVLEKAIMDNIRRRGCTCLIIAHRLSTIRDCDEIVVMDQGQIIERGTHEQLMACAGAYRRLVET